MTYSDSLLSKYYGVFTIRVKQWGDIDCFIMDNLLGRDFLNIQRIYDLKGSTQGRKVNLTPSQELNGSGLKVLKD